MGRGSPLPFWVEWGEFGLQQGIQHPQGSQRLLERSESVCERSQLSMFVLELHCFLFSILCSFFFPCKHFSHSAQELIKPLGKHSADVKVKNSQAIHSKPSAENDLSRTIYGECKKYWKCSWIVGNVLIPKEQEKGKWSGLDTAEICAVHCRTWGHEHSLPCPAEHCWLSREASKAVLHLWLPYKDEVVCALICIPRVINSWTPTQAIFGLYWKYNLQKFKPPQKPKPKPTDLLEKRHS